MTHRELGITDRQLAVLRLAGEATAREILAWKAEIPGEDPDLDPDVLVAGEDRASAALRAVLGIAREPTAAAWAIRLVIVEGTLRAQVVAPAQLAQAERAAMLAEIDVGFRAVAAPAFTRALAAIAR